MAWNIEKQNQLDQLLKEHTDFKTNEYETLTTWFKQICGGAFTSGMLDALMENATQVIQKLKPFSRNTTK